MAQRTKSKTSNCDQKNPEKKQLPRQRTVTRRKAAPAREARSPERSHDASELIRACGTSEGHQYKANTKNKIVSRHPLEGGSHAEQGNKGPVYRTKFSSPGRFQGGRQRERGILFQRLLQLDQHVDWRKTCRVEGGRVQRRDGGRERLGKEKRWGWHSREAVASSPQVSI